MMPFRSPLTRSARPTDFQERFSCPEFTGFRDLFGLHPRKYDKVLISREFARDGGGGSEDCAARSKPRNRRPASCGTPCIVQDRTPVHNPIILDDAFAFDDVRLEAARLAAKNKTRQVILFTCHNVRALPYRQARRPHPECHENECHGEGVLTHDGTGVLSHQTTQDLSSRVCVHSFCERST